MANESKFESSVIGGYQWILNYSTTTHPENNATTLTVAYVLKKVGNNNTSYNTYGSTVTIRIDGEVYTKTGVTFDMRNSAIGTTKTLHTKTVTIPHNSDGTRFVDISATHDTDIELEKQTLSGTIELDNIPRNRSTLTMSSEVIECGKTLTFNVKSSSDIYRYTITSTFYDQQVIIANKDNKSTVNWKVPTEYIKLMKNEESHQALITIETFNGTKSLGTNSYTLIIKVPETMAPIIDIEITEGDVNIPKDSPFLATISDLVCKIVVKESYDSEILEYYIGKDYETQGKEMTYYDIEAGEHIIKAKVVDSRGRTSTAEKRVVVKEYSEGKINVCDIDGLEVKGNYYELKINEIEAEAVQPASLQIDLEADGKIYPLYFTDRLVMHISLKDPITTTVSKNVDISDARIIVTWNDNYSEAKKYINLANTKGMTSEIMLSKHRVESNDIVVIDVECNQEKSQNAGTQYFVDAEYSFPEINASGKIFDKLQLTENQISEYITTLSTVPGTSIALNTNGVTNVSVDISMIFRTCIRTYSLYTGDYGAKIEFRVTFGNGTVKYYNTNVNWGSKRLEGLAAEKIINDQRIVPIGIPVLNFINNGGISKIDLSANFYGDFVVPSKSTWSTLTNPTINITRKVTSNDLDTSDFLSSEIVTRLAEETDKKYIRTGGHCIFHHNHGWFGFYPYSSGINWSYDYERDDDFKYYFTIVVKNLNKDAIYELCLDTFVSFHHCRGAKTIKITSLYDDENVLYHKKSEFHKLTIEGVTGIRIWFYGHTHLRYCNKRTYMRQIGWRERCAVVSSKWTVPDLNKKMKYLTSTEGTITSTVYDTGSTTTIVTEKLIYSHHVHDHVFHGCWRRDHLGHMIWHHKLEHVEGPCTRGSIDIASLDEDTYIDVEVEGGDFQSIMFTDGIAGVSTSVMIDEVIPTGRCHRIHHDVLRHMAHRGCKHIYFCLPWHHRHCVIKYKIYRTIKIPPTKVKSTIPINLVVPDSEVPIISQFAVKEANKEVINLGVSGYVAGKSKLAIEIEASSNINTVDELKYTTTITGASTSTYEGRKFTTKTIEDPGIYRIDVFVEDTRGRISKSTKQIVVLNIYEPPKIEGFTVVRCDADGNINPNEPCAKINCNMVDVNEIDGAGHMSNFILRGYDVTKGTEIVVDRVENVNSHKVVNKIVDVGYNSDWVFEALVTDAFNNEISEKISLSSIEYIKPTVEFSGFRCGPEGHKDIIGKYAKVNLKVEIGTDDKGNTKGLPANVKILYRPSNSNAAYKEQILKESVFAIFEKELILSIDNINYDIVLVVTDSISEERRKIVIKAGTDFDAYGIEYDGRFKPTIVNIPDDARGRVESLDDVYNIPLPYNGLIFYNMEDETHYVVNTLGSIESNGLNLPNRVVNTYRKLKADENYLNNVSYYNKTSFDKKLDELRMAINSLTESLDSKLEIDYVKVVTNPNDGTFNIIWHIPRLIPGEEPGANYRIFRRNKVAPTTSYTEYSVPELITNGFIGGAVDKVIRTDEYFVYSGTYYEPFVFYICFGDYKTKEYIVE